MNKNNYIVLVATFMILTLGALVPIVSSGVGGTVIVSTQLEVGNVFPEILNMSVNAGSNIVLTPNDTTTVTCKGLIQDWNNDTDITNVNATLYATGTSTWNGAADNNDHYVNTSCGINLDTLGDFSYTEDDWHAVATCNFEVEFYADPGAYNCSMTVTDSTSLSNREEESGVIDSLLAIGLPDSINYGIVDSITVSSEQTANVTNVGNTMVNLTLEGYAVTPADGYAMNCSKGSDKNIPIANERYNLTDSTPGLIDLANYSTFYTNMTSATTPTREFNLAYNTNDAGNDAIKASYWRMYVPKGLAGTCEGNIVFGAVQAPAS